MKRLMLILLLILVSPVIKAQSGWNITTIDLTINLSDIKFFNSSTGLIYSDYGLIKTTNGGLNWVINNYQLTSSYFICNQNVIYSSYYINSFPPSGGIQKTTNGGLSWTAIASTGYSGVSNFYFINENTGWCTSNYLLYRTENGNNFTTDSLPVSPGSTNSLYFTSPNTGYFYGSNKYLYKSTNKGTNWVLRGMPDMVMTNYLFTDTSNIYMCGYFSNANSGLIRKSTNGGLNWNTILSSDSTLIHKIFFLNSLTGYAIGNYKYVFRTSNGGNNWTIQTPDTSALCGIKSISFINPYTGWLAGNYGKVYNTTNGGSTFANNTTEIVNNYNLCQNYPNPFNPMCNVQFTMCNAGNVKIVVYDVMGREVQTLVDERLSAGTYEVKFDGSGLTSGVYFYRMTTDGFAETRKMLLIK